jgi:CheY-like chemotaxis protein
MPGGGTLTIETRNIEFTGENTPEFLELRPAKYVMLSIRDTGFGMDAETKASIFEPFFTTKPFGKGTGLGLSTVYGIVRQSEGQIEVESAPGAGTTVRIYLPSTEAEEETEGVGDPPDAVQGSETILLVEDEEAVRALAAFILRRSGYTILAARNADEALGMSERHPGRIHLLLTDVIMPGLNGRELAQRLTARRPDTKVLYISGYAQAHGALIGPDAAYLQKPFTTRTLARRVREVLDASA